MGIVNAIEVVNAFHGKDGLREFREWIESPDPSILGKLDAEAGGNSRKEGSNGTDDVDRKKQIFKDKHVIPCFTFSSKRSWFVRIVTAILIFFANQI